MVIDRIRGLVNIVQGDMEMGLMHNSNLSKISFDK